MGGDGTYGTYETIWTAVAERNDSFASPEQTDKW